MAGFQPIPSLDSINLLEHRETGYLLDHQIPIKNIIKELKKNIIKGRVAQGKIWGRDAELPCMFFLNLPLSPHLQVLTNPEVLQILSFGFLWRFCDLGMIDYTTGNW